MCHSIWSTTNNPIKCIGEGLKESVTLEALYGILRAVWLVRTDLAFEPRRKESLVGRECFLVYAYDVDRDFVYY